MPIDKAFIFNFRTFAHKIIFYEKGIGNRIFSNNRIWRMVVVFQNG